MSVKGGLGRGLESLFANYNGISNVSRETLEETEDKREGLDSSESELNKKSVRNIFILLHSKQWLNNDIYHFSFDIL